MIIVTVRKTGVLRRAWRISIKGGNNEKLPHEYNDKQSAIDTAVLMFGSAEPVTLRVVNEQGGVDERQLR